MEVQHLLAFSMLSLLGVGMLSQYMQQRGGWWSRAAPVVILFLLVFIVTGVLIALQLMLADAGEWEVATPSGLKDVS